jgi:hypothetical protein
MLGTYHRAIPLYRVLPSTPMPDPAMHMTLPCLKGRTLPLGIDMIESQFNVCFNVAGSSTSSEYFHTSGTKRTDSPAERPSKRGSLSTFVAGAMILSNSYSHVNSKMPTARRPSLVPDLFHIKRISTDSSGKKKTEICGTYTDPDAADAAARRRLLNEGYSKDKFSKYEENDGQEGWKYDSDVVVHAEVDGNEVLEVEVVTTPNSLGVKAQPGGRVEEDLVYILQSTDGETVQETEIRGINLNQHAAVTAARHVLLDHDVSKDWFKEYREIGGEVGELGDDVVVRAIGPGGEKYIVSVVGES